jgi:hypothetical protein
MLISSLHDACVCLENTPHKLQKTLDIALVSFSIFVSILILIWCVYEFHDNHFRKK